ncbi:MAG: hypothetical protein B7733_20715 [Myxococcales bacterium FL481]|nr:MAG: hypothetical protein B7733_20715 [Myxococcales bacterium FL481]
MQLTARQIEAIEAVEAHDGDLYAAADSMGISQPSIRKLLSEGRRRGERPRSLAQLARGEAPREDLMLTSFSRRGKDEDGNPFSESWRPANWKKQSVHELARRFVASLSDLPALKKIKGPNRCKSRRGTTNLLKLGDLHVGLLVWAREAGHNWDLRHSESILHAAVSYLMGRAPQAEKLIIFNAGDYFHVDNTRFETEASGHKLDADGRFPRIAETGLRMAIRMIEAGAATHPEVEFISSDANHDPMSNIWMRLALREAFRNNPRVHIDTEPAPFHYRQVGNTAIGFTHGHKCKWRDLPEVMAADVRDIWGATRYRMWKIGHVHHRFVQDLRGCSVEALRVLPPGDAWHVGAGYRSLRDLRLETIDHEYGPLGEDIFPEAMWEGLAV